MSANVAATAKVGTSLSTSPSSSIVPTQLNKSNLGILVSVAGIILLIVSVGLQYSVVGHGSSGQLVISSSLKNSFWLILTGTVLLAVGILMWTVFNTVSQGRYLLLFVLAFSSYFIANIALLCSLYQVNVSTS
jgi:hypothetical protein